MCSECQLYVAILSEWYFLFLLQFTSNMCSDVEANPMFLPCGPLSKFVTVQLWMLFDEFLRMPTAECPPMHISSTENFVDSRVVGWWSGIVVSTLTLINKVNQRWARLVLRWATVSGFNSWCRTFISVCNQPATQGQLSRSSLQGQ